MSDTLIRFNWNAILRYYSGDCKKSVIALVSVICDNYNMRDLLLYHKQQPDCWLQKPIDFVMNGSTYNQKCVYLHLATKRNWLDFEEYGSTTLPLHVVEDLYAIPTLQSNPLLTINNEMIDFKY